MSRRIFKYDLELEQNEYSDVKLFLPVDAHIIHVGEDADNKLCLWAEVTEGAPEVTRVVRVLPTGAEVPDETAFTRLGSVRRHHWIWHLYIDLPPREHPPAHSRRTSRPQGGGREP